MAQLLVFLSGKQPHFRGSELSWPPTSGPAETLDHWWSHSDASGAMILTFGAFFLNAVLAVWTQVTISLAVMSVVGYAPLQGSFEPHELKSGSFPIDMA